MQLNPNHCWDIMSTLIKTNIDKMCPIKSFNVKAEMDPWITNELLEEIRDKDLLLKKAKKTKLLANWEKAKVSRNRVDRLVEIARINYFRDEHEASMGDPKRFWRNISTVLPNHKKHLIIDSLIDSATGDSVPQPEAANYINKFFANVGANLAKGNTEPWEFEGVINDARLSDLHTDYEQVYKLIKELDTSKSAGLDQISSKFLKDAFLVLVPQLVFMFNLSLSSSVFPESWKVARVVPIYKGGSRSDVGNYRPISLLPLPGKLLERIAHTAISGFFEKNELLCDRQGFFRKHHSTAQSVAELTDDLFLNINNNEVTWLFSLI